MAEIDDIRTSYSAFDLNSSLTEEEQGVLGRTVLSPLLDAPFRVQEIEEAVPATNAVIETEGAESNQGHNEQYFYYMQCQALASLYAFKEGWDIFERTVLGAYVAVRQREDANYRGDDRDKAFSLRLRRIAAEDFAKFIKSTMQEAEQVPKPSLK